MSCLDNTDILRIVGGNSFQIAITVKARRVSDGSEIEDFDLSASSPVLNLIHAGEKTRKYFVTQGNQAIISFDGSEGLGYYGMEMSGSYNSEAWRFCIEKVLQLVDTNAKANIPEWSFLVGDTYFIEGTISIYGGGGGGDTVQADWTETNPASAAFILHKPDLSVYATKTEVASGLAGKQDTIVDLTSIRYGAAAGATAYQKPVSGIPESDMSDGVQSALDKADSAYQKPANGIPATDMSEGVQASLEKANSAVQTETDPVFSNSPAAEISQTDINNWNAKQPAIADLADIREGAAAGATAVQPDEMAQAIDGVEGDIADINAKIPSTASNLNQLADKAYVNSSIATNSATYRGSFNLITDLGMNVDATHAQIAGALAAAIVTADNNDYAFVQIPDSASTPTVIAKIERYKHNGSGWVYEYDLNNSGFTAAQWAAINSGITSGLVGKLADLPNNSELATLLNGKQNTINDLSAIRSGAAAGATAVQPSDLTEALNGVEDEIAGLDESKQDTIEDLSAIREGAAAGATAYQKPAAGIPESDMSEGVQSALNKAEDAYQLPASGIPSTDMSEGVQASLAKANSAVQTETDPVFSNSPAAEITQADINNWNAKQPAIADLADIREGAAAGATAVQPDEMAQAIDGVEGDIDAINAKIPTAASNLNQLADKAYVNSSIATNSATYRGSFNLITDLGMNVDATHAQIAGALATAIATADNNDYAFVQIPDSASTPTVIAKIERYKHNGTGWVYEYDLNNSGFTAAQWAAINSGITSGLVGKLSDLPNNSELATLLNGKQNVINDLSAIRNGAAAGATAYQKPSSGIPASDMSSTVQQELSKANTAVQTETDPIFSASPAAGITAQNIQTWNGEPAARQAADTALQNSVSTLQTDLAAETSARQSADAALQTAIQDEATARATADALLQQQYNALTQSDIIVGALPATGVPKVIYRVPGTTDFTDYMWYDNQFVPMATYGLPISAEFVVDNNLNKTQEEVNELVAQLGYEVTDLGISIKGGTIIKMPDNLKAVNWESSDHSRYVRYNNGTLDFYTNGVNQGCNITQAGVNLADRKSWLEVGREFWESDLQHLYLDVELTSSRNTTLNLCYRLGFESSNEFVGIEITDTGNYDIKEFLKNTVPNCLQVTHITIFSSYETGTSPWAECLLKVSSFRMVYDGEIPQVQELVGSTEKEFGKYLSEDETPVFSEVGFVKTDGSINPSSSGQRTEYVRLNGRISVNAVVLMNSAGLAIAFYDYGKTFINGVAGDGRTTPYTAAAPVNAEFVVFSNYGTGDKSAKIYASADSIVEELKRYDLEDINRLKNELNPYRIPLTEQGYINANTGVVTTSSNGKCTDFVDISSFKSLEYRNGGGNSNVASVAFYGENKGFLSGLVIPATVSLFGLIDLSLPAYTNVKYVRLSYYGYPSPDYTQFVGILRTSANVVERLDRLYYERASGIKVLVFGDSITDCTTISVNSDDETTSYAFRRPGNSYVDGEGHTIQYEMWPFLVNRYIESFDLRCYARSGASFQNATREPGEERRNLSYQIEVAFNDLTNPNNVFPTVGNYVPDVVIFALGTNDGQPNDTYETAMAKTVWNGTDTAVDVPATLANLDLTKFNEAVRYAFLKVKAQFPYALVFCVLPIERVKDGAVLGGLHDDLKKMANRHSIIVIDGAYESGILDDLNTSGGLGTQLKDGLHPNDKGQNLMTRMILSAINRNLVSPVYMNP